VRSKSRSNRLFKRLKTSSTCQQGAIQFDDGQSLHNLFGYGCEDHITQPAKYKVSSAGIRPFLLPSADSGTQGDSAIAMAAEWLKDET